MLYLMMWLYGFFFFRQKTAYDMRISDWSSDVCSSDLYFIGALPGTLGYDGSDDLLNPTRGFRVSGRLSPELSLSGQAFGYARTQVDASAYQPVSAGVVLAGRVRLGALLGAPRDAIAASRPFYGGGRASVRGVGYPGIRPPHPHNHPTGGRNPTD